MGSLHVYTSNTYLQKVLGRPHVPRYWEMNLFSRSIVVSPMRSLAVKRSQSITVIVSVWSCRSHMALMKTFTWCKLEMQLYMHQEGVYNYASDLHMYRYAYTELKGHFTQFFKVWMCIYTDKRNTSHNFFIFITYILPLLFYWLVYMVSTTVSLCYCSDIVMTYNWEFCWQFKHFPKHRIQVGGDVVILVIDLLPLATFTNLHLDIGVRLHKCMCGTSHYCVRKYKLPKESILKSDWVTHSYYDDKRSTFFLWEI